MTADYVAHHAAERPSAVAVISDGHATSFQELNARLCQAASGLRVLGLQRGATVAIGTNNLYLHWLLLLACERLGIAAASFADDEGDGCAPLLGSVDLVISAPRFAVPGARRHHTLTQAWVDDLWAQPPGRDALASAKSPDDPVRIVRTSGTTGASKRFLVTRRMHDALTTLWRGVFRLTPHSRYLQTLSMVVRATFDFGSTVLRTGGTIVLESGALTAIAAHGITHAILLPGFLKAALDRLPPDFAKPQGLTIVSFGAAVSDALREHAARSLSADLCDLYGTVELGGVSTIWRAGAEGFGTILPGIQVEAVDQKDAPVPEGKMGRIRIRSASMSERYIDDPEATRRMFRDGWFYPGDLGVVTADGRLKILGRADDLLNIGGQKILPAMLEASLMREEIAADVGVCSISNSAGLDELCIAVSDVQRPDEVVVDRVRAVTRAFSVWSYHLVKLDRIPRGANSKLQRRLLKADVARVLGR